MDDDHDDDRNDRDDDLNDRMDSRGRTRLVERLDHMVESGRVTEDEARCLRAAAGPDEFDVVVRSIRLRHAGARLDAAVGQGSLTRKEADGFLERLSNGEHPRSLRAHLAKFRRGHG